MAVHLPYPTLFTCTCAPAILAQILSAQQMGGAVGHLHAFAHALPAHESLHLRGFTLNTQLVATA